MKTGKRGVVSGINITPLTDIFLVLLIIMMLLPIIQMKELQVNIRAATNQPADPKETPKTFKMAVLHDKFTVANKDCEAQALAAALEESAKTNPDGLVIQVAVDSRHEQLAQALAAAKSAKIQKVAVQRLEAKAPADSKPAETSAEKPAPKKK